MSGVFSALITVFGIMFLGLIAERKRFFASNMALCLNQFVYWVSMPALLFSQMCVMHISKETSALLWGTLGASFACYLLFYLFFSRFFRRDITIATIRTLTCVFPNATFMGLPFILMVFPNNEAALTAAMLGALLYTGVLVLADAVLDMQHPAPGRNLILSQLLSVIRNPMIVSSFLGACIAVFGLPVPEALLTMTGMLGSTAAPCALFSMGMVLSAQMSCASGFSDLHPMPLVGISLIKLLLQPLLTFFILSAAGCTGITLIVGTLTAAMPSGTISYVVSERHKANPSQTSMTIIISTLLSLVSLPALVYILEAFIR